VCLCGTLEGIFVAALMENRFDASLWYYFKWNVVLFTAAYAVRPNKTTKNNS
jgi:hypothetical protein